MTSYGSGFHLTRKGLQNLICATVAANCPGGGGGGGTPANPPNSVQFNDAGSFGGSANFIFDQAAPLLTVLGDITSSAGAKFANNVSASGIAMGTTTDGSQTIHAGSWVANFRRSNGDTGLNTYTHLENYTATGLGSTLYFFTGRGTETAPTTLAAGDNIIRILGNAPWGPSGYVNSLGLGGILMGSDLQSTWPIKDFGVGDFPTYLSIQTLASGGIAIPSTGLVVTSENHVGVGTVSSAGGDNETRYSNIQDALHVFGSTYFGGSVRNKITTTVKTADYTVSKSDRVIFASSSAVPFTLTLPTAVSTAANATEGRTYIIKNISTFNFGAHSLTVSGTSALELIDGEEYVKLSTPNSSVTLIAMDSNWYIV